MVFPSGEVPALQNALVDESLNRIRSGVESFDQKEWMISLISDPVAECDQI